MGRVFRDYTYFSPKIGGDKALTLNCFKRKSTSIETIAEKLFCLEDLTVTAFKISSPAIYERSAVNQEPGGSWYIQKILVMYKIYLP